MLLLSYLEVGQLCYIRNIKWVVWDYHGKWLQQYCHHFVECILTTHRIKYCIQLCYLRIIWQQIIWEVNPSLLRYNKSEHSNQIE